MNDDTAVLVGGRRLLILELGCDFLRERDQGASHDIVLTDVDQRIEKDIAVRCHHQHMSHRIKIAAWSRCYLHAPWTVMKYFRKLPTAQLSFSNVQQTSTEIKSI